MCVSERESACVCVCVCVSASHCKPPTVVELDLESSLIKLRQKGRIFFQAQPTFSFNFNSKVVQLSLQTSVPLRKTSVLPQLCRLEQLSTDYIWQLYRFKRLYHLLEQLLIGWSAGKLPSFLCLFLNRPVVKLSFVWGSSRKVVSWWGAIFFSACLVYSLIAFVAASVNKVSTFVRIVLLKPQGLISSSTSSSSCPELGFIWWE